MQFSGNRSEGYAVVIKNLAEARKEFKAIERTSTNPYLHTKYADLTTIVKATQDALANHKLLVTQSIVPSDTHATVETLLTHWESGNWMSSTISLKPDKTDVQAFGAALTYAKRYSYSSLLGIVSEDDAESIPPKGTAKPPQKQPEKQAQKAHKLEINPEDPLMCPVHGEHWFKTRNMQEYAHKVKDTNEWCRLPLKDKPRVLQLIAELEAKAKEQPKTEAPPATDDDVIGEIDLLGIGEPEGTVQIPPELEGLQETDEEAEQRQNEWDAVVAYAIAELGYVNKEMVEAALNLQPNSIPNFSMDKAKKQLQAISPKG